MKLISVLIITLSTLMMSTRVNDYPKIGTEQETIESEDIIAINEDVINDSYDILGRAEEIDLTNEFSFINEVANVLNLQITRQIKIYQPEYKGQKHSEFSRFKENVIFYKSNNGEDNFIEISFFENELLGECIHIIEDILTLSISLSK